MRKIVTMSVLCVAVALSGSLAAQTLPDPARQAELLNAGDVRNEIADNLPQYARFEGVPELRFGLLVNAQGAVRTCLALPVNGETVRKGQNLCPIFVDQARFVPAADAAGNAIESVFVINFDETPGSPASRGADIPPS